MKHCEDIRARSAFYLDDELSDSEHTAYEAHLKSCAGCRDSVERERQFLESVRRSRPLYLAPAALRARVEKVLEGEGAPMMASAKLRRRVRRILRPAARPTAGRRAMAAVALLAFVAAGFWIASRTAVRRPASRPSDFAIMAVDTHLRHLWGRLPLEVTDDSPEIISSWFEGKVPFSLKLPNYQELSGQEKLYQLEGARLVGFKNDYAAYVAYQMRQRHISLVVTSDAVAVPRGGEEIVSKGLTFHYDTIDGLKVITWSDRGLTYALVSDLEERGQQSCVVCHAGTKDRDFIESLKPKGN